MFLTILLALMMNYQLVDFLEFKNSTEIHEDMYFHNYNFNAIGNDYYWFNNNVNDNNELIIFKFNNSRNDTLFIKIPDEITKLSEQILHFSAIKFHTQGLVLLYRDILILYDIIEDSYVFSKTINISETLNKPLMVGATKLFIDGDNIIGVEDFFRRHNNDSTFFFWTININDEKTSKFVNLPPPMGYYWTLMQPRTMMDYHDGKILCSDITAYNLSIYDLDGNLLDTITRDLPFWQAKTHKGRIYEAPPLQLHSYLQNKDDTKSLMHKANFVDNTTILVCYSHKSDDDNPDLMYHEYYDIWKLDEETNKWNLKYKDIDIYDYHGFKEDPEKSPLGRSYFISNGYVNSFMRIFENAEMRYFILQRGIK